MTPGACALRVVSAVLASLMLCAPAVVSACALACTPVQPDRAAAAATAAATPAAHGHHDAPAHPSLHQHAGHGAPAASTHSPSSVGIDDAAGDGLRIVGRRPAPCGTADEHVSVAPRARELHASGAPSSLAPVQPVARHAPPVGRHQRWFLASHEPPLPRGSGRAPLVLRI